MTHKAIFNKFIKIVLLLCRIKHQHAKRTRRKIFGSQCIKEGGDVVDAKQLVPVELISNKIYLIRGHKVMPDRDLALLYGVETRALNQAVSRNIERFPSDFMLSLTRDEIRNISQSVICSKIKHAKNVYAFTEQGVAMLAGVLNIPRAIQVNIAIPDL